MIKDLNPQILRGMTPAQGFAAGTDPQKLPTASLSRWPRSQALPIRPTRRWNRRKARAATIAKRSGIATKTLAAYNPKLAKLKSGNLVPGQPVMIPTAATIAAATSVPDPAIEKWGSASRSARMHVVKSGETLGSLAKKYHTSTSALMKMNGLKRAIVFPGQSIVVGIRRGKK